jgi:hypothetical protein
MAEQTDDAKSDAPTAAKAPGNTAREENTSPAEGAGKGSGVRLKASWMKARDGTAVPLLYKDVNGWAIVDGCVILGRSDELQTLANNASQLPETLSDAKTLGTAIIGEQYYWPRNSEGNYEIPYFFGAGMQKSHGDRIAEAARRWARDTRIRFRSGSQGENPGVIFVSKDFCASPVGMQGSIQEIWLSPDCTIGNIMHEMGHTIGLWHEHTRPDRDVYVEVYLSNVEVEARSNFAVRHGDGKAIGDYDYTSVMHYPANAFAIDPAKPTIVTPDGEEIGQRTGLSSGDIATVAKLYP